MSMLILFLFPCFFQGTMDAAIHNSTFPDIPIYVEDTWQPAYASDIQDVSYCWDTDKLIFRSNTDGKIYIADPDNCEYVGEVDLPGGAAGFGLAYNEGEYFINGDTGALIFYSDGSEPWSTFSNPTGSVCAGLDYNQFSSDGLYEASSSSPYQFYSIEPDGSSYDTYGLPGVNEEISGFMGHQVMTLDSPPFALILTTRFGHEFLFYWMSGGEYSLYGQESSPIPVSESLGLTCSPDNCVYWSYKGLDGQYYISRLSIPVFGGIDDDQAPQTTAAILRSARNPSTTSAALIVDLTHSDQVTLEVFDISGRLVEELYQGGLARGENTFSFSGSSGIYTALLRQSDKTTQIRFILTN